MFGKSEEEKQKEEELKKMLIPHCQWCGHDMSQGSYSYGQFCVFKERFNRVFYFDSKECLYAWVKGLIESDKAN